MLGLGLSDFGLGLFREFRVLSRLTETMDTNNLKPRTLTKEVQELSPKAQQQTTDTLYSKFIGVGFLGSDV